MRASLLSILRERNFPRTVGVSKKTELCVALRTKSAQKGGSPLHTHTHTHTHMRNPTRAHGCPQPHTHTHIHLHTGGRPAAGEPVRPPACRTAAGEPEPPGWPAWAVWPAPGRRKSIPHHKVSNSQMSLKYCYNTPMGTKMPSNHIKRHFCLPKSILRASRQGELL